MAKLKVAGSKTICIPFSSETEYTEVVANAENFRRYLERQIELHSELFPAGIEDGFGCTG